MAKKNWVGDLEKMRKLQNSYLMHLQDILKAANAGEILECAIIKMYNPDKNDQSTHYNVSIDRVLYVETHQCVRSNMLTDRFPVAFCEKLKNHKVYSFVEDNIIGYLRCFTESNKEALDDFFYCIYIVRKYQKAEEPFLKQKRYIWTECETATTFGDVIVSNILKGARPLPYDEKNGNNQYFHSQRRLHAGKQFTAALLKKVSGADGQELYENLHHVSALAYESQENKGSMVIVSGKLMKSLKKAQAQEKEQKLEIEFISPVSMASHKGVRKLFEIAAGKDLYLACDGNEIHGLISKSQLREVCKDEHLLLQMRGHLSWEIREPAADGGAKEMPRIAFDGTNFVLKDCDKNQKAKSDISRKLSEIPRSYRKGNNVCERCSRSEKCKLYEKLDVVISEENMDKVIETATEQRHGTTIVFSRFAKEEADRLKNTSFQICKKKLFDDSGIIKQLTAIDGAVLCDFEGNCYAIGVILDGQTVDNQSSETIERGARFNSAIRYKNAYPCTVICIVSEDGDVNVV